MNTNEDIVRILRAQAWERAKGELKAVAVSFNGTSSASPGQFDAYAQAVETFIHDIEISGLAE